MNTKCDSYHPSATGGKKSLRVDDTRVSLQIITTVFPSNFEQTWPVI